jgi:hypothetical protein
MATPVYLAGQVSQNAAGRSVTEQTRDILSIIDGLLAQAGTDKSRVLSANIWLTDIATFGEMNAVWDAWVAPATRRPAPPSRRSSPRPSTRSRSWWWRRGSRAPFPGRGVRPISHGPRSSCTLRTSGRGIEMML